ncbi:class I SAM-dependent methyltransferase [Rhodanobacter sp. IGA1.0]|uniref:Class I SAM-dependent methyltransferase n=1 Tax=Rhodanobacter sp. IGA1.0 TaxID=3158582 RepID=A0AAU7QMS6_9GAMM
MLRQWAKLLARTPLHPQWLLGRRDGPRGVEQVSGRLLDVGAADRWVESLVPAEVQYVALDYPATGKVLYGAQPHVFADAASLPFVDHCFDAVTCLEVLEHVAEPERVMGEISRVLKPGGRAWLSMPFLYPLHDAPFDFQRYTEFGLRRSARQAGLEVACLCKDMHALRTAGLLVCLALAGGVSARKGPSLWLGMPIAAALVTMINLTTWSLSFIWPDWSHMTRGYVVELMKE